MAQVVLMPINVRDDNVKWCVGMTLGGKRKNYSQGSSQTRSSLAPKKLFGHGKEGMLPSFLGYKDDREEIYFQNSKTDISLTYLGNKTKENHWENTCQINIQLTFGAILFLAASYNKSISSKSILLKVCHSCLLLLLFCGNNVY